MTQDRRPGRSARFALTASAALVLLAAVPALAAHSVERWSQSVWQSAMRGDYAGLMRQFERAPMESLEAEHAAHFKRSFEARLSNRAAAEAERLEARDKAMAELRQHIEDNDLSKALRSAVEAQTLGDRLEDAFTAPEIKEVIAWAKREIPDVKRTEDWLRAQELLYRLRTLYEDTNRHTEYTFYDEQLEQVNQRVALLSRYAPRQLHKLRSQTLERLGEEPLPDFNPGMATDWRERLDGVTMVMLRDGLRAAANRHIETSGWRPLLQGGLESLRVLSTTTLLDETFPGLTDQSKVDEWVADIDEQLERLARSPDNAIDGPWASTLIDRLTRLNDQTIGLPRNVLFREFGDGAMQKLDQFSEIIWPDKLRRFRQATEGNFIGVGIMIRHNEKREIVVINPLEGAPAFFAGIKPEDVIVSVDGEPTVGWSLNDAVDRITGPKGVTVKLGIKREDADEILYFPIVRDEIKLRTVYGWWKTGISPAGEPQWDWYVDPATRIAYVRLTGFNEDTFADLRRAWNQMNASGKPNGLILDLRYNPGGLLTSAVQITNLFISTGVIVSGEDKDGAAAWHQRARPSAADLAGIPTVVLINKGSASGSEIVAGALQAHGAAVIVGERTFGKGSVQTVETLAAAGGQPTAALKLTTQYYRLPPTAPGDRGRLVHRRPGSDVWGVDPDIEIRMSPQQIEESIELRRNADIIPEDERGRPDPFAATRPDINELLTRGVDPQLETALLILQARALAPLTSNQRRAAR